MIKSTKCCLFCFEKTVKFISNYSYVYIALQVARRAPRPPTVHVARRWRTRHFWRAARLPPLRQPLPAQAQPAPTF